MTRRYLRVSPEDGGVQHFSGLEVSNPEADALNDIDPDLDPNRFPRESGSDSYEGIPGDGIVPG